MTKQIFLGLLTFSLLLTAFLPVGAQNKKEIKRARLLEQEGDKAYLARDYKLAIEKYAESTVIVPVSPAAHFWKGSAHYKINEFDFALTELDKAAAQNFPKMFEIYKIRADINFQKQNYDAALSDVQKGLLMVKDDPNLTKMLGDISFVKKDYQGALDAYNKAVKSLPNNGDLEFYIAQSSLELGKTAEQGAAAEAAIKKGTKFLGESYYLAGDANQKQKKYAEALNDYQQSLVSKPDQYAVYRTMGEIYRAQSRFADAISISKKGLIQFPNDGSLYTDLSWYYSLDNRHEDAVQAALAAIRFLPQESLGYTNLCRAYNDTKKANNYQLAINACNKALTITPNDGETYFYLGRANQLLGKDAEAGKYYDKAVDGLIVFTKNNPEYSDGFYLLGNAYYADGQDAKAIEAYKKCLELSPNFSKARFNLGYIYLYGKNKNKGGATEQYNALLTIDKESAAKLKVEIDKN